MNEEETPSPPRRRWLTGWRKLVVALAAAVLGLVALGVILLESPIGHRYVADRIAAYAPASGLRISVGRIEGSLSNRAVLRHVTFSDPQGAFLTVPEVRLDWRPLHWFTSGIDVRELILSRGTLHRLPRLRPGRKDAPILPDFDIRIDRFEIDRLTVAQGVAGAQRRIDLSGRADIRSGKALVRLDGRLGGSDRLALLLDAEPDRDRLDIEMRYDAPRDGLLAGLLGTSKASEVIATGKGAWRDWRGALLVKVDGAELAALRLHNRAGGMSVLGLIRPQGLPPLAARAAGSQVALAGTASLRDRRVKGHFAALGKGLRLLGYGAAHLAENRFDKLTLDAVVLDPEIGGPGIRAEGAKLTALLDGPFAEVGIEHTLSAQRLAFGTTRIEGLTSRGTIRREAHGWRLPLNLTAARLVTGNAAIDARLAPLRGSGEVRLHGNALTADDLVVAGQGLTTRLALRGDIVKGGYALAGPVTLRGWPAANVGLIDADARIVLGFGKAPWQLRANMTGRLARTDNATIENLAGAGLRFAADLTAGQGGQLAVSRANLNASKLSLALTGRRQADGRATMAGSGRHTDYGPFTLEASIAPDGPRAVLVLADPLPAARLRDVRLALSPAGEGFRIETSGASPLGPFEGTLGLVAARGAPVRIAVDRLAFSEAVLTGRLVLMRGGALGELQLSGGGTSGTIRLEPRSGGQGVEIAATARDARFGGADPLGVANGKLQLSGLIAPGRSTLTGSFEGAGIARGNLFLGRIAAQGRMDGGKGSFSATLAGRRGSRFNLQLLGDIAPRQLAILAGGDFAGQRIAMPRRAVLNQQEDGWQLMPSQVDFGGGRVVVSGRLGGRDTELDLALARMPLSLADVVLANAGLGGVGSGLVTYRHHHGSAATGSARLQVRGLTRSGLVLTSRPVDADLVADLTASAVQLRAVVREQGQVRGRIQGRISGLPASGALRDRLRAGQLFAQMRYDGPADAVWRLVALEAFDLTGSVALAADVTGSIDKPVLRGSLGSSNLRLQSALTGTDISGIAVAGHFAGSRLDLNAISGRAANGGQVSGSGFVDFAGIGTRAPALDLKLAVRDAQVLARSDMSASVTGPLRIVSDGQGGTIAGRVRIESARWRLGRAAAVAELPNIQVREVNRRVDIAPPRVRAAPWRFLIDAAGANRVEVEGLGLDSEWGADIRIRGTTAAPAILGRADLVRGGYQFAGQRFELKRGRISFDGGSPPNPRLDIMAEAQVTGLSARVTVQGTSLRPEIAFTSTPAMPEEELLARLLFGSSITQISAPEALQLGAALASLRSGGGLDPINQLRSAIGLDRLRIVSADAALGRSTGVAAGKYLGRRVYAEVITDGRGYSATELEFRVTSWLSVLGSVSTIGRQGVNVKVSKDY